MNVLSNATVTKKNKWDAANRPRPALFRARTYDYLYHSSSKLTSPSAPVY
jgi:hypothetical protein